MPRANATLSLVAARRAAAPAGQGGGATRLALLRRLSDQVDELQRLEGLEARSARDHDRKIDLAETIAAMTTELVATYRGPAATRAPLWRSADGTKAAW